MITTQVKVWLWPWHNKQHLKVFLWWMEKYFPQSVTPGAAILYKFNCKIIFITYTLLCDRINPYRCSQWARIDESVDLGLKCELQLFLWLLGDYALSCLWKPPSWPDGNLVSLERWDKYNEDKILNFSSQTPKPHKEPLGGESWGESPQVPAKVFQLLKTKPFLLASVSIPVLTLASVSIPGYFGKIAVIIKRQRNIKKPTKTKHKTLAIGKIGRNKPIILHISLKLCLKDSHVFMVLLCILRLVRRHGCLGIMPSE